MKLLNSVIEQFWKRWNKVSNRTQRESQNEDETKEIVRGDFVLIHEDGVKRHKWKLGRIEGIISCGDRATRGTTLRTCRKDGASLIRRPLQKVYPLEIEDRNITEGNWCRQ